MRTGGTLVTLGLGALIAACTLFVDSSELANGPAAVSPDASGDDSASSVPRNDDGSVDNSPVSTPDASPDTSAPAKDASDPASPSCKPNGTACDQNEECCSDGCKSHKCSN